MVERLAWRSHLLGVAAMATMVLLAPTPSPAQVAGDPCPVTPRRAPHQVTVPSREYPTLQAAVCAVRDGGTVVIEPGTHDTTVVIWGKDVVLKGRARRNRPETWPVLRAPLPSRVDPPREPSGIITVAAGGGLTLRKVRLEGGVAGIFVHDRFGPARAIDVRFASFGGGGIAGIVHVSRASLEVKHATFGPNLDNGIAYTGVPDVACTKEIFSVSDSSFLDNSNVAIFIRDCQQLTVADALVFSAALLSIEGSGFAGILMMNSGPLSFDGITVSGATGFGIAVIGSSLTLSNSLVENTHAFPTVPEPTFGDGITVVASSTPFPHQASLTLKDSEVHGSARGGVTNFGSFVSLENVWIGEAAFPIGAGDFLGFTFSFSEQGSVCGVPPGPCVATVGTLQPPAPVTVP